MVMLVTLNEASDYLRRDSDDDDANLEIIIRGASAAIINYLKKSYAPYVIEVDDEGNDVYDSAGDPVPEINSAGEMIPKDEVRLATLYLIGVFYRERDGEEAKDWDLGFLPKPVMSMLYQLRDPACA